MSNNTKAPKQGMHLAKEAQAFSEKMRDGVVTGDEQRVGGVQGGAYAAQLPRKFEAFDRMDDEMNTKMQLMNDEGMTPFGQVYYDERVGKWLQKKEAAAEAANLDAWFNREFNKNDLASRQLAQELYPDFYKTRERELLDRMQEVYKLKMIQLRGPQSKEDLYKLWLLNTGRVVLPPDWDRIGASPQLAADGRVDTRQAQGQFMTGLVRMPLFQSAGQRLAYAKNNVRQHFPISNPAATNDRFGMANNRMNANNNPLAQGRDTYNELFLGDLRQQV
jgi:hypothetical protein